MSSNKKDKTTKSNTTPTKNLKEVNTTHSNLSDSTAKLVRTAISNMRREEHPPGKGESSYVAKNQTDAAGEVEVLYQKMGGRWFAFSVLDDEVFVGSISQEQLDGNEAENPNWARESTDPKAITKATIKGQS